jgi:dTDP-4-amino-4,6-dideoxygalactose transaminase
MIKKIKLFDPLIDSAENKIISKVLKSKLWASGSGTGNVSKFETKMNQYLGSDECIAVNSGTAALNLSLSLTDIKNKEVILPSLSFVSTAHAVILNGGKPVFVDIEPNTLCIDPDKISNAITKKTKVILPVHFAGMPCDIKRISSLCKKHNLLLIEDAAHATGSMYNNKKIGTHGTAVCFSFHPVKNLAMPTGGLIALNHKQSKKFRKLLDAKRWCGITDRLGSDYDVKDIGWNYYMNEFSAAIGLVQLKKINQMNRIRQKNAQKYYQKINLENKMPIKSGCTYHFYWIMVENRDEFRKKLAKKGIETGIHYKPIHKMSMYKQKRKLEVTDMVSKKIVSLPTHPNLKKNDINFIIKSINDFS